MATTYQSPTLKVTLRNVRKRKSHIPPPPKRKKEPKKRSQKKGPQKKTNDDEPGDKGGDEVKEKKKRKGKGNLFKMNFHGAKKYKMIKKLLTHDKEKGYVMKDWIKQLILRNEFGSGPRPHPHTHAVLVTKEKFNFEQFKEQWKKETIIKIADIERAKHFSTDVKYVTKEDY